MRVRPTHFLVIVFKRADSDEFAEVKAVKLLRRGRRLQQVEAVYGKVSDEEDVYAPPPNIIPKLQPVSSSSADGAVAFSFICISRS